MIKNPSKYQTDIFDWFENPSGSIAVDAKAGSGKTSTMVHGLNLMPTNADRKLFAAFNKSIVEELTSRLPRNVNSQTFHSIGFAATKLNFPTIRRWDVNEGNLKYRKMARNIQVSGDFEDKRAVQDAVLSLLNYAQVTLTPLDEPSLLAMADRFGVQMPDGFDIPIAARVVAEMLELGKQQLEQGLVSFSDMIYMPAALGLKMPQYDFIAVDEAQDLNKAQMTLIQKSLTSGGSLISVGDPHQCQPRGTKVLRIVEVAGRWDNTVTETVNIEDLQPGDRIATCNLRDQCFYSNGEVLDVQKRPYSGKLVSITTAEGHFSQYTPNHRCLVSFKPFVGQSMVYVMRKGSQYRVGISTLKEGVNSAPLLSRLRCEKGDAIWILSFHPTRREALIQEAIVSGVYGLPQTVFSDAKLMITDFAKKVWEAIGDNSTQGEECLRAFHRDPNHPLFTNQFNYQQSLHRPQIIAAANLMDGCLMLPYGAQTRFKKQDWLPISVELKEAGLPGFPITVYSLKVSGTELYIADGLVTHNSIYMFAGAESDSFNQMTSFFDSTTMPLNYCYRCPQAVIAEAQKIVPSIECPEGTPEGKVAWLSDKEFKDELKSGDMVLCRLTAPLVKLCFQLLRQRIPAKIKGRDIGENIASKVKQIMKREVDMSRFPENLYSWRDSQLELLRAKFGSEDQQQNVEDITAVLEICFTTFNPNSVNGFMEDIKSLFNDGASPITLCTVHRAKGLENDRVFIVRPDKLPLSRKGMTAAQSKQEMNLKYVAITRAKRELYFVHYDPTGEDSENSSINPGIPNITI